MSDKLHLVCPHCSSVNRVVSDKIARKPKCGACKSPLFTGSPVAFDSASFHKNIQKNDIPVLVDFWAPWCGPCRIMAPAFQQAAAQLEPNLRFGKVNTEDEQALASQFNIFSIPTTIIFKNGKEIARQAGAMNAQTIIQWVKSHV